LPQSPRPDLDQIRWLPCLNISGAEIPPFGVVRLVEMNTDGQFEVDYPNQNNYPYGLAFNGPTTIPAGGVGSVTCDTPFWAHYDADGINGNSVDSAEDTPVAGDIWGPVSGSFALVNSASGFRVLSSVDPFGLSACMVILDPLALPDEPEDNYDGSVDSGDSTDAYTSDVEYCDSAGPGGEVTLPLLSCDDDGNQCVKLVKFRSSGSLQICIEDPNDCD